MGDVSADAFTDEGCVVCAVVVCTRAKAETASVGAEGCLFGLYADAEILGEGDAG
jgi:hypothetical protein